MHLLRFSNTIKDNLALSKFLLHYTPIFRLDRCSCAQMKARIKVKLVNTAVFHFKRPEPYAIRLLLEKEPFRLVHQNIICSVAYSL